MEYVYDTGWIVTFDTPDNGRWHVRVRMCKMYKTDLFYHISQRIRHGEISMGNEWCIENKDKAFQFFARLSGKG
ncbi:unnamed protein product [marine sediment metagenome]|uniref:Uncharacterized protein n=1 Tax=marine sediment metagenome TaxID=412755 RepID=X1SGQ0_9ZZZZ